ncbi:hypothetical protein BO71DRAFT_403741 [Aspergillus ellipticus CBS 707.79]|uniref:Uncharacterized protein n=1 Tax=Aspergillus ellipticus CBS 707.79 TaxID=1448320 RepID=A0A319DC07_9EURO|nr:hypothetical protein BO71DRAFT_403741 [Aspergillus ellipticus CBS 707.79]
MEAGLDLIGTTVLRDDDKASIPEILKSSLDSYCDLQRLDIITNILTASPSVDDRIAEIINASWEYLCDYGLWSLRYESLQQFRQFISYSENILPIIKRFKKSDKKKLACLGMVKRNWSLSGSEVLPPDIAPINWSKHLLSLLSALSKWQTREQAVLSLRETIQQRPKRSRQQKGLIASDIQRVLDKVVPSQARLLRSNASGGSNNHGEKRKHQVVDYQGIDRPEVEAVVHWSPMETMPDMFSSLEDFTDLGLAFEPRLTLPTPLERERSITSLSCGCATLCFPLTVLLTQPSGDDFEPNIVKQLLQWARDVSWSNICAVHLQKLASLSFGPSTETWPREEIIETIEELLGDHLSNDLPLLSSEDCPQDLITGLLPSPPSALMYH